MSETTTETRPALPRVRARRGRIGGAMQQYGELYRQKHPERDVRFVRDPVKNSDQSNVTKRLTEGYVPVTWADMGDAVPGKKPSDVVRLGDVILMSIPTKLREEALAYEADAAAAELDRIEKEFYDVQQTTKLVDPATGKEHVAMPRGGVQIRQETIEVEREQPTSETPDAERKAR